MAVLNMELYSALEKDIAAGKKSGEPYKIHLSTVKNDLAKRKRGWLARVIILAFWAVVVLAMVIVASGVIELGGASGAIDPETGVAPDVSYEPPITFEMIPLILVPATWTLCFVGFPIGWGWGKDDRKNAKNQIYVQHTVYDDGTVDTYTSTFVPKLAAFVGSLIFGCLTMCFSLPLAIVQLFTWKRDIKRIEGIIKDVESMPDVFVCD